MSGLNDYTSYLTAYKRQDPQVIDYGYNQDIDELCRRDMLHVRIIGFTTRCLLFPPKITTTTTATTTVSKQNKTRKGRALIGQQQSRR